MSTGNAAAAIGLANTNKQGPIGPYVQDALAPSAANNYIGINTKTSYSYNALGEAIGFTAATNEEAAAGGVGVWVKSLSDLVPTDKVTIVAGEATLDNAAGTHMAVAKAGIGDYLWVVDVA